MHMILESKVVLGLAWTSLPNNIGVELITLTHMSFPASAIFEIWCSRWTVLFALYRTWWTGLAFFFVIESIVTSIFVIVVQYPSFVKDNLILCLNIWFKSSTRSILYINMLSNSITTLLVFLLSALWADSQARCKQLKLIFLQLLPIL